MGAGHSHGEGGGHDHSAGLRTAAAQHKGRLKLVAAITATVMVVEVVGGLMAGSLGLLADAGHMAADAAGVSLALFAVHMAAKPATERRTFGLARAEILAAAVNAVVLFGLAVFFIWEGVERLLDPVQTQPGLTIAFATVGMVCNMASLLVLARAQADSLNLRGAFLEVLNDTLGSAAVIVSAIVIATTGFGRADAIASMAIAVMILPRAWKLLRQALDILLEAAPEGVDMAEVRAHIVALPGVREVHDLHAWTLTSGLPVLSAHVVVEREVLREGGGHDRLLDELQHCLGGHFDVEHCTFQLEPDGHAEHEAAACR
jgi:cobalt-zinc-cadmium efflux system protein